MSLPQILGLALVEIVGDYGFKQYANDKGLSYLGVGIVGYLGVMIMLVISLQDSTILMVNNAWDLTNSLLTTIFALSIGERFEHVSQYVGLVFVIIGGYLLKIPLSKTRPFHIPLSS